jgi:hypothetical protein
MAVGVTNAYRWSARKDAPGVTSGVMALVVTGALFASALAAMIGVQSLPDFLTTSRIERTTVVWLPPVAAPLPRVAPPHVSRVLPTVRTASPVSAAPVPAAAASATSPTVNAAAATSAIVGTRTGTGADSTTSHATPIIPLGPIQLAPTQPLRAIPNPPRDTHTGVGGAPVAPAAVTNSWASLTTVQRDSIVSAYMAGLSLNAPMSDRERADIARRDYRPAIHEGQPDAAARSQTVGAGVSIPLPLFSPGPSAAQRKRDSIVAAENGLRLARLHDRLLLRGDSVRTDSLRRDSVARARKQPPRIIP